MAALDAKFVKRLHTAIGASDKKMKHFRARRKEAMKDFVGHHYGAKGKGAKQTPFNMIAQAIVVYVANLVAKDPRYKVRSTVRGLRPFAADFTLGMNHQQRLMGLRGTLRDVVTDSMFGYGVVKCGLGDGNAVETDEGAEDVGVAFVDRVSPDDYILDPAAKRREEADFEGNKYRLPLDFVKNSGDFKNTKLVQPSHRAIGEEDDAKSLSDGASKPPEADLEDYTELMDIWLPRRGLLVTLSANDLIDQPLKVVEWDGPEAGPYLMLGYHMVPDNAIPLPPVALWTDLHEWINTMARKLKRRSDRDKKVLAYEDKAAEDAARIVGADDGETIKVTDINALKEIQLGGETPFSDGMIQFLVQMFSREAGNIDHLGGLAAKARTATEASLVSGQASIRLGDMQAAVYEFVKSVGEHIAWYLFTDPAIEIPLTKKLVQLGIEIDTVFSPEVRAGEFPDYVIDVEPYSMAPKDPASYTRQLMDWWTAVVLPTLPMAVQQGGAPNIMEFWRLVGKEMNLDEVDSLLVPGPMSAHMLGEQAGQTLNLGMPSQKAGGGGQTRGEYQTSQTFSAAQQGAPKPQAAPPIKSAGV